MEFDLSKTAGLFVLIVALGAGSLIAAPMMSPSTVLMMVLPSMVIYGLITLAVGVKHGEYRAKR